MEQITNSTHALARIQKGVSPELFSIIQQISYLSYHEGYHSCIPAGRDGFYEAKEYREKEINPCLDRLTKWINEIKKG